MAFGKDSSHLDTIPSYGGQATLQQQISAANEKPQSKTKSNYGYWKDNFVISERAAQPSRFRLIRGDYVQDHVVKGNLYRDSFPFYKFSEHFRKVMGKPKGGICSAGPFRMSKEKRLPCMACDLFWEEWAKRKDNKDAGGDGKHPNSISVVDKNAFNVLDYGYFFEMPDVDPSGQVRLKRDNTPWTHWEKAVNTQDPKYSGRPWKEGHIQPWAVSSTWLTTLVNQSIIIGNRCSSCATGYVQSRGWHCSGCRALMLDPNNTAMTPEQVENMTKMPHSCPHCGHQGYLSEEVQCNTCAHGKRATLFDVDLYGFKEKSGDKPGGNLIITQFVITPIQFQTQNTTKVEPLDLPSIFAPTPYEVQAKVFGLEVTQAASSTAPVWGAPPAPPAGPQVQAVDPAGLTQSLNQYQYPRT